MPRHRLFAKNLHRDYRLTNESFHLIARAIVSAVVSKKWGADYHSLLRIVSLAAMRDCRLDFYCPKSGHAESKIQQPPSPEDSHQSLLGIVTRFEVKFGGFRSREGMAVFEMPDLGEFKHAVTERSQRIDGIAAFKIRFFKHLAPS